MLDFLTRLGGATVPILSSITTVALLTVLRLLAPTVRWRRRLKQDSDVLSPLPQGDERERWAASVETQAIRLRLYYEANTRADRTFEWVAFVLFFNVGVLSLLDVRIGSTFAVGFTAVDWPVVAICAVVCCYVVTQLIRGFPVVPRRSPAAKEYLAVRRAFHEHRERVYATRRRRRGYRQRFRLRLRIRTVAPRDGARRAGVVDTVDRAHRGHRGLRPRRGGPLSSGRVTLNACQKPAGPRGHRLG